MELNSTRWSSEAPSKLMLSALASHSHSSPRPTPTPPARPSAARPTSTSSRTPTTSRPPPRAPRPPNGDPATVTPSTDASRPHASQGRLSVMVASIISGEPSDSQPASVLRLPVKLLPVSKLSMGHAAGRAVRSGPEGPASARPRFAPATGPRTPRTLPREIAGDMGCLITLRGGARVSRVQARRAPRGWGARWGRRRRRSGRGRAGRRCWRRRRRPWRRRP